MQVGRGARLVQVIGPAVQLREEDGKPRGDMYQLNGVERGQARAEGVAGVWSLTDAKTLSMIP